MDKLISTVIHQFQRKGRCILTTPRQNQAVALPDRQVAHLLLVHPFQHPLVALADLAFKAVGGVKVHIFHGPRRADEGDDAAKTVSGEGKPRLLLNLPQKALLRALPLLKFTADADPLVPIDVLFLFYPMEQQILPLLFYVA